MANSLYQALGGIQPQAQPAALAPSASADPGAGSLFQQLLPQQPQLPGSEPLQMGPMLANAGDLPPMGYTQNPQVRPPVTGGSSAPKPDHSLDKIVTNFVNRGK